MIIVYCCRKLSKQLKLQTRQSMRDVEKPDYLASQAIPPGPGLQFLKSKSSILIPPQKPVIFISFSIVGSLHSVFHLYALLIGIETNDERRLLAAKILPKQTEQTSCHHGLQEISVAREWQHNCYYTTLYRCHPKGMFHMHTHAMQRDNVELLFAEDKVECIVCVCPVLQADRLHLGFFAFRSFRCFGIFWIMRLCSEVKCLIRRLNISEV